MGGQAESHSLYTCPGILHLDSDSSVTPVCRIIISTHNTYIQGVYQSCSPMNSYGVGSREGAAAMQ